MAKDVNSDPAFAKAIWGLGSHYPNMQSGPDAEATGKPLWASEEDSTYNNAVGAACWARVINNNYVRGNMSASVSSGAAHNAAVLNPLHLDCPYPSPSPAPNLTATPAASAPCPPPVRGSRVQINWNLIASYM